jgi:hypothetical protein
LHELKIANDIPFHPIAEGEKNIALFPMTMAYRQISDDDLKE